MTRVKPGRLMGMKYIPGTINKTIINTSTHGTVHRFPLGDLNASEQIDS